MKRINRPARPAFLTDARVEQLTAQYAADRSSVWNRVEIKEPLARMSTNSCAYCETSVGSGGAYMEVEHFISKDQRPDLVVDWGNLLPSCKRCNSNKLDHDVIAEPIVEPSTIDPRQHLSLRWYRYRGKDELGRLTVDVLGLNERSRLLESRFAAGAALQEQLEEAANRLAAFVEAPSTRRRNVLVAKVTAALEMTLPGKPFAASAATLIVSDDHFDEVINTMKHLGLWSEDLQGLLLHATAIAFS